MTGFPIAWFQMNPTDATRATGSGGQLSLFELGREDTLRDVGSVKHGYGSHPAEMASDLLDLVAS